MTRRDYEIFRDEVLKKRFYWCMTIAERNYLIEKGYRYLFRCTHYQTNKFFWVFDLSEDILKDIELWKTEHRNNHNMDVKKHDMPINGENLSQKVSEPIVER